MDEVNTSGNGAPHAMTEINFTPLAAGILCDTADPDRGQRI